MSIFEVKVALRMLLYRWQYFLLRKKRDTLNILDAETTVRQILADGCSVCRYGDGELDMITSLGEGYNESRKSDFQNYDERLAVHLKTILENGSDPQRKILVCIPYVWKKPCLLVSKSATFIKRSFVNNSRVIFDTVNTASTYGDSYFTRFYIDFKDKNKEAYIRLCQRIWAGRDICIIEGDQSRLGIGNDLFGNAASIERILCPAVNAFSRYEQILDTAKRVDKSRLILIALGQTATVLAYDLAFDGYQAIDLGHIDIEYEWFLMKATEKVPVSHKYVNEIKEGRTFTEETDAAYLSQIIARIK